MLNYVDKVLVCRDCGREFVFSAGEQELYRLRGIPAEPDHCPNCARGRVLASSRTNDKSSS